MRASTLQHEIIALLIFHHHQLYIGHVKEIKKKKKTTFPINYLNIIIYHRIQLSKTTLLQ